MTSTNLLGAETSLTFLGEGTPAGMLGLTKYAVAKYGEDVFTSPKKLCSLVLSFRDAEKVHKGVNSSCNSVMENLMNLQAYGSVLQGIHRDKTLAISTAHELRVLVDKIEPSVMLPPPLKRTQLEPDRFRIATPGSSSENTVIHENPNPQAESKVSERHVLSTNRAPVAAELNVLPAQAPMNTLKKEELSALVNAKSIKEVAGGDVKDDALALACDTVKANILDPKIQGERMRWIVMANFRASPVHYQVKLMERVYHLVPGYRGLVDDPTASVSKKVIGNSKCVDFIKKFLRPAMLCFRSHCGSDVSRFEALILAAQAKKHCIVIKKPLGNRDEYPSIQWSKWGGKCPCDHGFSVSAL